MALKKLAMGDNLAREDLFLANASERKEMTMVSAVSRPNYTACEGSCRGHRADDDAKDEKGQARDKSRVDDLIGVPDSESVPKKLD
jgi:hypothetical protein